ncbi:acetolactate decarboxylase [Xenorhabdus sp. XENO-7]|uniref:Acetolactate decarboxylase n=1 Tax=Xenorhabdus aichiensis TaxID=3025874 RepID=A0ABT5LZG4_9GAMM|nr:acetolactate decarboxylase [Xenorhabdus aichiensis]MDC9620823.1 acetolactate decarboxylase [Xenorhabdus aichiensis]
MKSRIIKQYSTVYALMAGVFDRMFTVSEISHSGRFDIGCLHALTGEITQLSEIARQKILPALPLNIFPKYLWM